MGGTSYTSLALAQIPDIFFDYILLLSNPDDLFKPTYSLSATRLLELSFYSHSNKHFGFNTELTLSSVYLNQLILNNYWFHDHYINNSDDFTFNLLERVHFYSANPYKKLTSEPEDIEYYDTSTVNYENFINI